LATSIAAWAGAGISHWHVNTTREISTAVKRLPMIGTITAEP